MNTEQPLALRLADYLDVTPRTGLAYSAKVQAAAELRRLHEAHEWQYMIARERLRRLDERLRRIEKLEAENEELRAAITKLHKAKGRYHTQIAVCDLFELCGLTAVRPARAGEKK